MSNSKNSGNKNLIGLILLGAALGAVLGILFAPEKGSETRKKLKDGFKDLTGSNDKQNTSEFENPEEKRSV